MVEILFMQRATLNLIAIWTLFNLFLSIDGHREDPDRFGQLGSTAAAAVTDRSIKNLLNLSTKHVIKITTALRYFHLLQI